MKDKLEAYRHADTMGKSQLDLVLMVYDGAIKALKTAGAHYRNDNIPAGQEELLKAERMVVHLYTTLDGRKGGQVAAHLSRMYSWVIAQLRSLGCVRDLNRIESVIQVLGNLRSGWAALKDRQSNGSRPPGSPTPGGENETHNHVLTTA